MNIDFDLINKLKERVLEIYNQSKDIKEIDGVLNVKPSIGLSSAAGKLFVEEAGGKITNLNGHKRDKIDTLLVTNGKIHNEIINAINFENNNKR